MKSCDPIQETIRRAQAQGAFTGWHVSTGIDAGQDDASGFWFSYAPAHEPLERVVGFKLHVSASRLSAAEVLQRALPILTRMRIPFKHACSADHLALLSNGRGGPSQIGKFLTAYPPDTETARRLADLLHEATKDLQGPRIPSEPEYCPGSLVHYRYGGFIARWIQLPTGRIVAARDGYGGLEVDVRDLFARPPTGTDDPFATKSGERTGLQNVLLRDRYIRVQRLHQSPKGFTWLGFDERAQDGGLVIIKEAFAYVMEGSDGLDARQRLRKEADCLHNLESTGLTPVLVESWEEGKSGFLVYRLIEGPTFASILNSLAGEALRPPDSLLRQWMSALSSAVASVHRFGYVLGDIKPSNVIFTGDGFRFIDLELSGPPTEVPTGSMGTPGYCSPEQSDPSTGRGYSQDIYAMGATLLAAATLTDASILPDGLRVAQIELARWDAGCGIFSIIQRCLATDHRARFESAEAISEACGIRSPRDAGEVTEHPLNAPDFPRLASEIGDTIASGTILEGEDAWWVSGHPAVGAHACRDIYAGSAGTALFLCELYDATQAERYLDLALRCGRWLWTREPTVPRKVEMPGLYFGESGPGLLYLKLHLLTGSREWLDRARDVSERVSRMRRHSPDLMTGAAGTGLFHLSLWHATTEPSAIQRARADAYALLDTQTDSRPTWMIPPDHEGLSGKEYIGFAHGSAGVGYFLAECCLAQHDARLEAGCSQVADWVIALSRTCLPDRSGVTWPLSPDDATLHGAYWCHGAAGIARFLLRAFDLTGKSAYLRAAEGAGRTLAKGATWIGTTQCHGLAGNADILVDVWSRIGGEYLAAAQMLGENLTAYRTERGWPSESRLVHSPDLMVGQAGVGAAFLRLAAPLRPHLMSPQAFARRK